MRDRYADPPGRLEALAAAAEAALAEQRRVHIQGLLGTGLPDAIAAERAASSANTGNSKKDKANLKVRAIHPATYTRTHTHARARVVYAPGTGCIYI